MKKTAHVAAAVNLCFFNFKIKFTVLCHDRCVEPIGALSEEVGDFGLDHESYWKTDLFFDGPGGEMSSQFVDQ